MKLHPCIPARRLVGSLLALGLLSLAVLPAPSEEPSADRERQIADLRKQIAEQNQKLEDLKKKLDTLVKPAPQAAPAPDGTLPDAWVKTLHWRSIGPAAMGGRIVAFAVVNGDPNTYFVATASGGLLKTTNNGTTFAHQFDHQSTVSIGDVCVAPSNPNIVWVGTGENNPRNSVSYGDGVYKSTDGGKTWQHMGLKDSFQIGRIAIHPTNPDIVYVGALGRLYGPNPERGLYKTTDGGKTWTKVLNVDDKTGVIDVQLDPANPENLLAATWERKRDEFDSFRGEPPHEGDDPYEPAVRWGPGSGLYRSTDGGTKWTKITQGLPTCNLGRMGISYYRKDPKIVYLIVDSEKIGMGKPPSQVYMGVMGENVKGGAKLERVTPKSPAAKAGLKEDDVITAIDGKPVADYAQVARTIGDHQPGDKLVLKVLRGKETKEITVTLEKRPQPIPSNRLMSLLGITAQDAPTGVKLTQVPPEGLAAKANLKPGDVVVAVNKKKVKTVREFLEATRGLVFGDKVQLDILQGKQSRTVVLTPVPPPGPKRPNSGGLGGQPPNIQNRQGKDGFQYGGIYKSTDGGVSWERVNSLNPRPFYFSQVRVDPSDDKYVYVCGIQLYRSKDGGKTFTADGGQGVHPDQHALWIDPRDGRHMLVGCDGGFYATYDRMGHWDFLNTMAIGQFYHVAVDSRQPYHVYGGLQDNGSWGGPSRALDGRGPTNGDWIFVNGGDGFVCQVDPGDPDLVYYEIQDGGMGRVNLKNNRRAGIRPVATPGASYRFNWNTPFILSSHNPRIFYCGGNYVFRSLKEGDDLRPISPEITRTKRGSATALAESPRNPDVLYVGTDDGALWVTRDGGAHWTDVAKKVGLPGPRWVASIEPSHFVEGRAYVAFDAHRSNDDAPYLFVTEDFGQTWKPIRSNLPTGSTRVLREDPQNQDLLFTGTEFAVWVSVNRGASWTKLNSNLPTVAVHELAIHPTAGEMVAATHGRSLWILDITPLRQITPEVLKAPASLLQPNRVVRWRSEPFRGSPYGMGSRFFAGENPPYGAQIYYALTAKASKIGLKIVDYAGKQVAELKAPADPGLHVVPWNMIMTNPNAPAAAQRPRGLRGGGGRAGAGRGQGGRGQGGRGGRGRRPPSFQLAPAGMYRVVLTVDGKEFTQGVRIESDPTLPQNLIAQGEEEPEVKPPEDEEEREEREAMERERKGGGRGRVDD